MQLTPQSLRALGTGFQATFMQVFDSVKSDWSTVAMEVPSGAALETYGWMKELPGMREFVGQRVINNLEAEGYQLRNKTWEHTIGVKRTHIEDDVLGLYRLAFSQQGEITARHPDELVYGRLESGFSETGLDGQYYFDSDHVGYTETGAETSWSNVQAGSGAPWFLMDLSRATMKPLVFQKRLDVRFIRKDKDEDDNAFLNDEFWYGARARYAAGFGFHQLALGSKAALDATNYEAARQSLMGQRRPDGTKLPVMPTHLVYGSSNEGAARRLIENALKSGGESNEWAKSITLKLSPHLP